MLVASRLPASIMPSSSITIYDNSTDYSQPTNSTSLVPPTAVPKYFNVPFAIQHGYFRSIRYLLELHCDPNERDGQLRTPLILCAYVENDRWSLSLSQNLLEKGAKIALEDNARRNAMHHACALQRFELVQVYLSCLDFNIQAQDCEGNTCLHYVAITGNSEIAELLMRSAEKTGIRLDRFVNREGCSAAVLALKYGHIECANQITHRDSDEFFVVPRPLSIYENPPTTGDGQSISTSTKLHRKSKTRPMHSSSGKTKTYPATLPFGLLKIMFNDSDTGYSTRLASLCKQDKQIQHLKQKKQETPQVSTTTINNIDRPKSTTINGTRYCSTQVLVNESQLSRRTNKRQSSFDSNGHVQPTGRISPRIQLLVQQQRLMNPSSSKENNSSFIQKTTSKTQLFIDDMNTIKSNDSKNRNHDSKYKLNGPTIYRPMSNIAQNQSDNTNSRIINPKLQRPKTSIVHNRTSVNPTLSQFNSNVTKPTPIPSASAKKNLLLNDRLDSSSTIAKQNQSVFGSEPSGYPQTLYNGRPASAVTHHSCSKSNELSYPIREAKGPTSRYNKPEELFGLRPEELFGSGQHQPTLFDQHSTTKTDESIRSKRSQLRKQQHIWQQDVDKLIELYNIHHSTTYRKSAIPPAPSAQGTAQTDSAAEITLVARPRRSSITKHSSTTSKSSTNSKQSTLASLNISRRNSVHRPSMKLANA